MKKILFPILIVLFSASLAFGQGQILIAKKKAETTPPTLTSSTIPSAGTSISLLFSETVVIGAGGNGGWTIALTGGSCTMTYSSGSGSNTLVYSLSCTVNSPETGTVAYTQPGNGVEDSAGNDLATIASAAATNNSTQYNSGITADSNAVALWRMESGALTTDSKGTNTLTNVNAAVADTVNFKEGAASADIEFGSTQYFYITDANLNAGYPLKSGDTTKNISVCAWIKLESLAAEGDGRAIYGKIVNDGTWFPFSFFLGVQTVSGVGKTRLSLGYSGGYSIETVEHASSLSLATWYHVSASYQNSDKAYAIRIRDTNGAVVGTDLTGTATLDANKLYVGSAEVCIGSAFNNTTERFDGLMDEVVVFKDIITAGEATAIAKGIYR